MNAAPSDRARHYAPSPEELANIERRFRPKVLVTEGCWEWQGSRQAAGGYGRFWIAGSQTWLAHRVALLLDRGSIPANALVLHHCDNSGCVRPDHLYLGSAADNMRDRTQRGRTAAVAGARHVNARLTDDDVRDIRARAAAGESKASISRSYPVTRQTVSDIVAGKMWRSV